MQNHCWLLRLVKQLHSDWPPKDGKWWVSEGKKQQTVSCLLKPNPRRFFFFFFFLFSSVSGFGRSSYKRRERERDRQKKGEGGGGFKTKLNICLTWWKSECYFSVVLPLFCINNNTFWPPQHDSQLISQQWTAFMNYPTRFWHSSFTLSSLTVVHRWNFKALHLTRRNINIWINRRFYVSSHMDAPV